MGLKNVFVAVCCATLLAWSGSSRAEEYRADEFLGLDLSTAVLSPKRLGPASQFAPVAIEARTDRARTDHASTDHARTDRAGPDRSNKAAQAHVEQKPHARIAVVKPASRKTNIAQAPVVKPRGAARTKLAHRHGNPLDAQAQDTRVQAWPCKSGGICNWK
jgi:hypothetical protein